jgi:hypothetical protein
MALFAVAPELAAVNVGMTVHALGSRLREIQIRMTLPAIGVFVPPLDWKSCLAMVKIRERPDRLPA